MIVVKRIISLTLALSFLVMSVTGLMLFIVPKGKVAYWANWQMFGLTKTQYGDIHITSMFLFLTVTVWHIYYNWKPLLNYLRDNAKRITFFKKELLIALSLNATFVAGTLVGVQPFQSVLDINADIKAYWEREYGSPPYGHAEESSLASFSRRIGVDIETAIRLLKEKNIAVDSKEQTLLDISKQNNITPKIIFDIIRAKQTSDNDDKIDFLGRRTLGELAGMNKINLKKSIDFLEKKGVKAASDTRMKKAATALDITPYQLYEKLKTL
ncbi:DUF4405 domain-containing protein [Sulfurimonas sp.]|uniref:DUF4405 domain-containing protein n=1 Tax=Sulfurimonas sp. TaxID=2022749 RepID=UPI0035670B8D